MEKKIEQLKNILKNIKSNKTFKKLDIRGISLSNLIHPSFSEQIYKLIIDSDITKISKRHRYINILKYIRTIRVNLLKQTKLVPKNTLFMIFNKREIHEGIYEFFKIMDKENTNLIIREPYFHEFGAYKLIPKGIEYSFFYSYIDLNILRRWRKEKRELNFAYHKLINDPSFRKIFVIDNEDKWPEAKKILRNFFREELYWSALIILITEKIISLLKPKVYVNINCFSYCTREVAWTMKKHGVKVVHIQEGPMDYYNNLIATIYNKEYFIKYLLDHFFVWGYRDKRYTDNITGVHVVGATKQPNKVPESNRWSKENMVLICLSTSSHGYTAIKRQKIVQNLDKIIRNNPSYQFKLKLHPSGLELRRWYTDLLRHSNFEIIQKEKLYSLLSDARYVLVELSTVGSEAPIFNADTILLTVNSVPMYDHPIFFKARNSEEVTCIIKFNKSRLRKYRKQFIKDFLYKIDNKTYSRIRSELRNILKELN